MLSLEQTAAVLYGEQKYPQALDIYLSLYKKSPKTEKYSIFCGNCYDALGKPAQAIRFYKKASKLNPASTTSLMALANLYYQRGDYKNSEKFSLKALKAEPKNQSALINLGNIAYCLSDYEKSYKYYQAVYNENKASYIALINMANVSFDLKHYALALEHAGQALHLYPSSVDAYIIRGNAYLELGKFKKSEKALINALDLNNQNPWIYNTLSRLYQKLERWDEALAAGWKAVVLEKNAQDEQHINFGYLLYEYTAEKKGPLAQTYAAKWFEKYFDNELVTYMASAILSNKQLNRANAHYIAKLFDSFAADFDSTLAELDYQVPAQIAAALKKVYHLPFYTRARVLDLGCGTGLCAEKIKPALGWSNIEGVDLSEKMLKQAEAKGVYSALHQADILEYLKDLSPKYHLITAADVLTYFGDLKALFENITHALGQNGIFIFSISENMTDDSNYTLTPSGRFVHQPAYVLNLLKKCGCKPILSERKVLRTEGASLVYGYIIAARKEFIIAK